MERIPTSEEEAKLILKAKEIDCIKKYTNSTGHCPVVWDKLFCWPETPAGATAEESCPSYYFFNNINESLYATKKCHENGTWNSWSNYSVCMDTGPPSVTTDVEKYVKPIKTISAVGYAVSLTTLAVAFVILASFKRLRCPRNVLHMHLFVSFMLRAGMRFLRDIFDEYSLFQNIMPWMEVQSNLKPLEDRQGTWSCKLMTCVWQYAIISNYSWILMEGLYLHNLIFLALFTDTSAITIYILLGWGIPLGCVVPWGVLRALYEDTLCWTRHITKIELFIKLPVVFSTVVNFFMFLNIVRVLLLKLTASISEERRRYRRWAKSTLVLVPLFGAHYAIVYTMTFVNHHFYNETVEAVWLTIDQLFGSFQGTFVAVLYCFLNAEVQAEISKLWVGMEVCGWRTPTHSFLGVNGSRIISRKSRPSTAGESCMTSFISTSAQCDGSNYRRKTIPSITPACEVTKLEKPTEEP
uniref:Parathyroid hormone 2 receptor n=2 Tax=Lygus hesperus TaxID=30085 RepID=A0A0A9W7W3_LYGHE